MRDLIEPDRIERVSRATWQRLQTATEDEIKEALLEYLGSAAPGGGERLRAFQARRKLVVERLQARIDQFGEAAVLY